MPKRILSKLLFILSLSVTPLSLSYAHEPSNPAAVGDVRLLVKGSGLILHGKVAKVVYVNGSQEVGRPVPHAFVTYDISEVLFPKTDVERQSITLRFVGGPDGQGRFLDVVGVPKFMEGDEDILFVAGNGENGCPIVMCEFGRYRVLDGLVYEAHGSPVAKISTRRIVTNGIGPPQLEKFEFPAPTFDELMKNPSAQRALKKMGLSMDEARKKFEAEAPKVIKLTEGVSGRLPTPRLGMKSDGVLATLRQAIGLMQLPTPDRIVDADPGKPFFLPNTVENRPLK